MNLIYWIYYQKFWLISQTTNMLTFIMLASGLVATTYGWKERFCGSPMIPVPCALGAVTASGEIFDPDLPSVAVPMPENLITRPTYVWLKIEGGSCKRLRINDKKHWRYIGTGGFDLTPAAVRKLTGSEPKRYWSAKVYVCEGI